jgi:hypothetical protein
MDKKELLCESCGKQVNNGEFYFIYRLAIITESKEYEIGIGKLLSEFGDYLMKRGSHLSASEIILLRPDIMQEFLIQKYKDDDIVCWYFKEFAICYECYEEYKNVVPLI